MIKNSPAIYKINFTPLGDTIACLPALRYAIENIHTDGNYLVECIPKYESIIKSLVPSDKVILCNSKVKISEKYRVRMPQPHLHQPFSNGNLCTPNHMHLVDYVYYNLLRRIPRSDEEYAYPSYKPVSDIEEVLNRFNVSGNYIVIPICFVAKNRRIPAKLVNGIIDYCAKLNIKVVLLGRENETYVLGKVLTTRVYEIFLEKCIDLVNKTSIDEAAIILSKAQCVVGFDSGLIHLAGMCNVPIICGYTSVPSFIRNFITNKYFKAINANCECAGCFYKYQDIENCLDCPINTNICCDSFKIEEFTNEIQKVLENSKCLVQK